MNEFGQSVSPDFDRKQFESWARDYRGACWQVEQASTEGLRRWAIGRRNEALCGMARWAELVVIIDEPCCLDSEEVRHEAS
jgi:hypothetical protein